jgi:hypothetical protein
MTMSRSTLRRRAFTILVIAGLLFIVAPIALANVRVEGGGDVPFYARLGRGEFYHNDTWAAIVFYRPPECIPIDFNLLDFFDIPGAFGCTPYTTDGFAIWKHGPEADFAPIMSNLHGLGVVPVWFVSWPALQAVVVDDVLTIGELESLQPLQGSASFYHEILRPTEAVNISGIEFNASGMLEDGRSFHLEASAGGYATSIDNLHANTLIVFK